MAFPLCGLRASAFRVALVISSWAPCAPSFDVESQKLDWRFDVPSGLAFRCLAIFMISAVKFFCYPPAKTGLNPASLKTSATFSRLSP